MADAAMAQLVEHILGKDEVPGPNPGSSSRHPRDFISGLWLFYRENPSFLAWIFLLLGRGLAPAVVGTGGLACGG